MYYEKKTELGDAASKLRNGLSKIDETRSKVEGMSLELEEAKKKVAQFQKQCEEYLVVIVQQKREADEQQKVRVHPFHAFKNIYDHSYNKLKSCNYVLEYKIFALVFENKSKSFLVQLIWYIP